MFERLGATPWAERARVELHADGETPHTRDPNTLQQLTPEELQAARLAAQGLTNQQIADRLFLSRHTVGYYLHKVYSKLAITSRTELGHRSRRRRRLTLTFKAYLLTASRRFVGAGGRWVAG